MQNRNWKRVEKVDSFSNNLLSNEGDNMLNTEISTEEKVARWVSNFNQFPLSMIKKLMELDAGSWHEVTTPSYGSQVFVTNSSNLSELLGEIIDYQEETDLYRIQLDFGETIEVGEDDFELLYDDVLPSYGWIWQFKNGSDIDWFSKKENLRMMSNYGFRIYEHDTWGFFFGVDACGEDFYAKYWMPLYTKIIDSME